MANFSTYFDEEQFIKTNLPAFTPGHPKFNLTTQGKVLKSYPELFKKLKAKGKIEQNWRKTAADRLRVEIQEMEQKLTTKRQQLKDLGG